MFGDFIGECFIFTAGGGGLIVFCFVGGRVVVGVKVRVVLVFWFFG